MSSNSSRARNIVYLVGLPAWVFAGFIVSIALAQGLVALLYSFGVSFTTAQEVIVSTILGAFVYALCLAIIVGVPWLVRKSRTTKQDLGLTRYPRWLDGAWALVAMVAYVVLSGIVLTISTYILPFVDYNQAQETQFTAISSQFEYILAFVSLVLIAPIAEEVLFRGYLFGKLRNHAPLWVAILITSVLFGIVHFQWNVGIDVFVLSIVLCFLRVWTGSLWSPIFLHMLKNGMAFYFLFINPTVLSTLGG